MDESLYVFAAYAMVVVLGVVEWLLLALRRRSIQAHLGYGIAARRD